MKVTTQIVAGIVLCLATTAAFALGERGTPIHQTTIYVSPDASAPKLAQAERGHELIVLETSRDWLHVEALLNSARRDPEDEEEDADQGRTVTGWVLGKDVIRVSTPNGDQIVFGEAVDSEDQASRVHGRRGAAQDAMRLYYRMTDLFPSSPLAAESLYRAADDRWQLEKQDVMSRPSAKEQESFLRGQIDEHWMKELMKKFPTTKWADLAAFHLIDNKLCGDWQGASKCPLKEAEIYEKYVKDYPQSPATPEALYQAAWRWSALVEIYKTEGESKKSDEAKSKATALATTVASQFPQSDWGARAQRLLYLMGQDIPTYGNAPD
jgi:outer membrane protein assembly factor BamD (BamD/ComL family)